ncbi:hypothetical protein H5410_037458 [Solanum commersonii]|uniref:Uncharacterized protein n=1 Tax=Solanum commersonii TaxID=4109 RepID=A0A9J5Y832_SOLCO|nr:hypothetical protein H5410_037458 [Solanum commersonii]
MTVTSGHFNVPTHEKRISTHSMDTLNPAVFVNAEFLKEHVGKKLAQFKKSDGDKVIGNSTDEKHLPVKGYLPNPPLSTLLKAMPPSFKLISSILQSESLVNLSTAASLAVIDIDPTN